MSKTLENLRKPWMLRLFMWKQLPAAAFMGLRLYYIDANKSQSQMRYGWSNTNPFKSMYFAAQAAAAEFASGALALVVLDGRKDVSMLVLGFSAQYHKKATGLITFTCSEGALVRETVEKCLTLNEAQIVQLPVLAHNEEGIQVASFQIEWSFKRK